LDSYSPLIFRVSKKVFHLMLEYCPDKLVNHIPERQTKE
jgi:hypothetical protein